MNSAVDRSEEHTSELQSHSEISYAVFCLKKKTTRSNKSLYDRILNYLDISKLVSPVAYARYKHLGDYFFLSRFDMMFFFFNDTATTEIYTLSYTLSLHDALPI